eukprot:8460118-Lingulodinium_polyedra.AAC.1
MPCDLRTALATSAQILLPQCSWESSANNSAAISTAFFGDSHRGKYFLVHLCFLPRTRATP